MKKSIKPYPLQY